MSRLPRLHSSPDRTSFHPELLGMKRKTYSEEEEAVDEPRKLPAFAPRSGPLRPSRTINSLAAPTPVATLTKPQPPSLSTSRIKARATSAPPKSAPMKPSATLRQPGSRILAGRIVSGSSQNSNAISDKQFQTLQAQVKNIESARAADAEWVATQMDAERAKVAELQANHVALERELATAKKQELDQRRDLIHASDEMDNLRRKYKQEITDLEMDLRRKDRELREAQDDLRVAEADIQREREIVSQLRATVTQLTNSQISLTAQNAALQTQLSAARSTITTSSSDASNLRLDLESARKRVADMQSEALQAEALRRKLHNTIQELKGNIRVFCRVRPVLTSDIPLGTSRSSNGSSSNCASPTSDEMRTLKMEAMAKMDFPDIAEHKEIVLGSSSESATGQERKETWNFSFDRVFEPNSTQSDIFEEVSQLAQSCTDGYNVCIFAYGQTGSGKSFTMEGGCTNDTKGMIPRAVDQVFRVAEEMQTRGWEYKMEGQFLEIYNETINDLLGKGEFDKKKHEIKHEKGTTKVTDVVVVPLSSPTQVRSLLSIANSRRTVAATLMNERSSRSHSVFTLRITGTNERSGESCSGSLNLVDLAGSERLNSSGAGSDKDRLKETQNINRSLSALGDVVAALGEKGDGKTDKHIPYRNSKLTYLLQNSLSGNSKTLMILNLSPLSAHLQESLCSLRFATKVNNTTIGTAKKQIKNTNSS